MNQLNHVAIIMDGNGRWGLKKNQSRNFGHLKGLSTVQKVIKISIKRKIPFLTLYTFSTENWNRPDKEINFLFDLIRNSLKKNIKKISQQGIKVNIIGKRKGLPGDINEIIKFIEKKTKNNNKMILNLALNYGSKEEIVNACNKLIKKKVKKVNIVEFENNLYTNKIPNPDILIRTGGKKRLSNFLLMQLAYTEIFFVNKLWPDFSEKDYNEIISGYIKIKRNFGNI
jgi:undecaprenyl diphosphate synthase